MYMRGIKKEWYQSNTSNMKLVVAMGNVVSLHLTHNNEDNSCQPHQKSDNALIHRHNLMKNKSHNNFFLHYVFMSSHVPSKNNPNMIVDCMVVLHTWPMAVENNDLGSLVVMVNSSKAITKRKPRQFLKALVDDHIIKWT